MMSTELNTAIVKRFIEEVWNQGRLDLIDQFFDPNYVNHNPSPGQEQGTAALKQFVAGLRAAAPDLHYTIDDLIAVDDKVVMRWTARGTHLGELMGIPATGREVTVTAIVIDQFSNGRIVEHWAGRDDLGMMQQLGVIPQLG
jgi:steroid delta-isomerase-like uncharacterized protein